ncbi:MAG: hypothetical protein V1793_01985 [Pseudomonadota bacterium]
MTRKITLSIPDMLHEKMEEWRLSFNLSKMFQDALSEAIHKKEEFQKRLREDATMSEIIDRLRQEKLQSEGSYSEKGKREGVKWAKSAHYDDLIHALDMASSNDIVADDRMATYFSFLISKDSLMEISQGVLNKYARLYVEGWRKGVSEFWLAVKEKL